MKRRLLLLAGAALATAQAQAADFSIADYGAKADGSKVTRAVAAAIAAAERAGGGRVIVPRGTWLTGAIRLRSEVELHLADGAELVFSQDPTDYLPAVETSWEGMECWNYSPLIYAYGCTNVAITGHGTLRGYAGEWSDSLWSTWVPSGAGVAAARRQLYDWSSQGVPVAAREIWKRPNAHTRPHFVQFNRCRNVRWEGFTLRNSPFWTLHLYLCTSAVVRGLDVSAHGNNTDGIDIEMSRDVLVENCIFDQGDDGVVIKSGRNQDAWRLHTPTENVLVRNCEIRRAKSLFGIGSEISGGVRNVRMENCRGGDVNRVFFLKTNHRRGGFLEDIVCENVICRRAKAAVFEIAVDVLYEWAKFPDYATALTRIEGILARNIRVEETSCLIRLVGDAREPPRAISAEGLSAGCVTGARRIVRNVADFEEDAVRPFPDVPSLLSGYVRQFNAADEETVTNRIPNAAAEAFLAANLPRFACSDEDIERTYYFRGWTYRKHLRLDMGMWTVSEFLPNVSWGGPGNLIVCAAGHHLREGRWLRDSKYVSDDVRYWLTKAPAKYRLLYSSWLFTGACAIADVTGDETLPNELLDAAVMNFEDWERGVVRRPATKDRCEIRMGGDGKGGFVSLDCHEGTEKSLGGNGHKPLFSSAMWSEAACIARVARRLSKTALADQFDAKAEAAKAALVANCWNEGLGFFTTRGFDSRPVDVRELHGYAPWYFGVPTEDCAPDWTQLSDFAGFAAQYGLTFPERRATGFRLSYEGHECQWNGPSWPFATSIALTAYANDLHARPAEDPVRQKNAFAYLLWQYAAQQKFFGTDGDGDRPWIDENFNPDRPDWIARTMLRKRGQLPRERGKDYNHSTFVDLVVTGLVGFIPTPDGFTVDPLASPTWDYFALENLRYRGHDVSIRYRRKREGLVVEVDGREVARRKALGPLAVRMTEDRKEFQQARCLGRMVEFSGGHHL